jgi:hypothetical protein
MTTEKCLQEAIDNNDGVGFEYFLNKADSACYPLVFGLALVRERYSMARRIMCKMTGFRGTEDAIVVLCQRAARQGQPENEAIEVAKELFDHWAFSPEDFDEAKLHQILDNMRHNNDLWRLFTQRFPLLPVGMQKSNKPVERSAGVDWRFAVLPVVLPLVSSTATLAFLHMRG